MKLNKGDKLSEVVNAPPEDYVAMCCECGDEGIESCDICHLEFEDGDKIVCVGKGHDHQHLSCYLAEERESIYLKITKVKEEYVIAILSEIEVCEESDIIEVPVIVKKNNLTKHINKLIKENSADKEK